jgi:hypothetical protein
MSNVRRTFTYHSIVLFSLFAGHVALSSPFLYCILLAFASVGARVPHGHLVSDVWVILTEFRGFVLLTTVSLNRRSPPKRKKLKLKLPPLEKRTNNQHPTDIGSSANGQKFQSCPVGKRFLGGLERAG